MKNKTLLGVLFFLLPLSALATSGACSGHSGVSCSAGPDRDGSVICVDGWRNSTVQYSTMEMCRGYASQPVTPPAPKPVEVKPIEKPKTVPAPTVPAKTVAPTTIPTTTVQKSVEIPVQEKKIEVVVPQPAKKSFWSRVFSWF